MAPLKFSPHDLMKNDTNTQVQSTPPTPWRTTRFLCPEGCVDILDAQGAVVMRNVPECVAAIICEAVNAYKADKRTEATGRPSRAGAAARAYHRITPENVPPAGWHWAFVGGQWEYTTWPHQGTHWSDGDEKPVTAPEACSGPAE